RTAGLRQGKSKNGWKAFQAKPEERSKAEWRVESGELRYNNAIKQPIFLDISKNLNSQLLTLNSSI
ncbi:MAG: hypothetical protein IK129_04975, partial [Deltaproteobacteria bacterium]|nr:hypothetical protein [Deltaproteobacteria bacterium]